MSNVVGDAAIDVASATVTIVDPITPVISVADVTVDESADVASLTLSIAPAPATAPR